MLNLILTKNFELVLQAKYNEYKKILEELQIKIIELGNDKEEHEIVLNTLHGTDSQRICYRMIGNSLIKTNVQTTLPILEIKKEKLDKTISSLKSELAKLISEFEKWKKDNKIQIIRQ